jgi:GTPase-associated protein 1, N-terminal domain type 2
MEEITIEQAVYGSHGEGGYRFLARSPGFLDDWLPEAARLCMGFGDRPAGMACPAAVFALPLGKRHVAVVQVADQGADDTGRPGALGFHLLVLPRNAYAWIGGDPFRIVERFCPPWQARGDLPPLPWNTGPLPPRTVAEVQQVLQRSGGAPLFEESEVKRGGSHVLLGGAQALVDGGRLLIERPAPDTDLLRALWTLLPTRARSELWPASFAFDTALPFHAVVVPPARSPVPPKPAPSAEEANGPPTGWSVGFLTEEKAADYPEGRYEYAVQHAAESGDQRELDTLFARRGRAEVLRTGVLVLVGVAALVLLIQWLPIGPPAAPPQNPPASGQDQGKLSPDLPPAAAYPDLSAADRRRLTDALAGLATALKLEPAAGENAEDLLDRIDRKLGTRDARRDPGPLKEQGPVQRRLRVLLWKRDVGEYKDPGLNPVELVERLQQKEVP